MNSNDFRELTAFAKRLIPAGPPRLRGDALMDSFQRSIVACELVSFDIFDTLVVRRVAHPAEVFLHLQRHVIFRDHRFGKSVARLRVEAENAARQRAFSLRGSGEVDLPEIYAEFCRMAGLSTEAISSLVHAEETVEIALCRPNPQIAELVRRSRMAQKEVIAVSDTYHRGAFLHRLLEAAGIAMPPGSIYPSSEHRVNKQGGQLFGVVCRSRRVAPSKVLHVGDHPISDHQTPLKLGMPALLHGNFVSPHPTPPLQDGDSAWIESSVRAMRAYRTRCTEKSDFWRDLGYCVFGPFFSSFCQWLHDRFREDGIQRAYFLLRDGELLHRVYRCLFDDENPSTRLLHSSRRAMVLPTWTTDRPFAMANLLVTYEPRPAREFLDRLGLSSSSFTDVFRNAGFRSPDELVDIARDTRILAVFGSVRVQQALTEAAEEEKQALIEYVKDEGVWDCERAALVDTGWNGTIQKAVQMLANEISPGRQLHGYYIGTFERIAFQSPPGMSAKGYWVHEGKSHLAADKLRRLCRILEIVSANSTGSTVRFRKSGEKATPMLSASSVSQEQLDAIAMLQEGIVEFATDWRRLGAQLGNASIPLPVAIEECVRLQAFPTKEEAEKLGDLALSQDMGTSAVVSLARFRDESVALEDMWKDFETSAWREGLANRPCEKAATIRTLLWLGQN
ncbi:MAG: hypothetical protein K2X38_07880 [Gemmataceae bacterium]|nr:hypothetical protein [Gemmataceae bacterium]